MDISKDEGAIILGINDPLAEKAALTGAATLMGAVAFAGLVSG